MIEDFSIGQIPLSKRLLKGTGDEDRIFRKRETNEGSMITDNGGKGMKDAVFTSFLEQQLDSGLRLAAESDLLELVPMDGTAPQRYIARFRCRGLVRTADGEIVEAEDFAVGITFPDDYLRCAKPASVITWLGPRNVFHPNISDRAPVVCVGRLSPGTELVDLLFQLFEMITWRKVTMREDDALNPAACVWARGHRDQFPVDTRPLKRRAGRIRVMEGP
jgi:hypothetical protein